MPRLSGITPPAPADETKKEQFALMMIMLFMPLALPVGADAFDEGVILELLGDVCDYNDDHSQDANGKEMKLSYHLAWTRWFNGQRKLSDQFEELQVRARKDFDLEDCDMDLTSRQDVLKLWHIDPNLTGLEGLDDSRRRPSGAEFMAHITVKAVTNLDLVAKARVSWKTQPRPAGAEYRSPTGAPDDEQVPSGPHWGPEVVEERRDAPVQTRPAFPLSAQELVGVSLLNEEKGMRACQYRDAFMKGMGRCHAPPQRGGQCTLEPFAGAGMNDGETYRACLGKQRVSLKNWQRDSDDTAKEADVGGTEDPDEPRPAPVPANRPDEKVQFVDLAGQLDEAVQRLFDEFASRREKPVDFSKSPEQLAFIARVVDHLKDVLMSRRLGENPSQRVFLLLGQGGTGKSEVIQFVRRLVDMHHDVLTHRSGGMSDGLGPSSVVVASTNAASANIGGDTIHTMLRLGIHNYSLHDLGKTPPKQAMVTELNDVHLLVVDEISMLSPALFTALSYRLCQARKTTWGVDPNLFTEKGSAFGAVPLVILAGDFLQLPAFQNNRRVSLLSDFGDDNSAPPKDTRARRQGKNGKPIYDYKREMQQGRRCFWEATTDVHLLTQTHRFVDRETKKKCPVLPEILNYMRKPDGELMKDKLWRALQARVVDGPEDPKLKDPRFRDGYEVASEWSAVARLMQYRARRDAARANQMLVYVQAVDRPYDKTMVKKDYMRALQVVNYSETGNRAGLLPLFVGMRVRLTRKLAAKYGLVNEATGVVESIQFHEDEFAHPAHNWRDDESHEAWQRGHVLLQHMPQAVFVKFDKSSLDCGFGPGVVAVEPWQGSKRFKIYLHGGDRSEASQGSVGRYQIPLMPEQVRTTQTAQGMSMDRVKLFLAKGNQKEAERWMNTYVMLSRARTLDGLLLFDLPPRDYFCMGPPKYIVDAMGILEKRAQQELAELSRSLKQKYPWVAGAMDSFNASVSTGSEPEGAGTKRGADPVVQSAGPVPPEKRQKTCDGSSSRAPAGDAVGSAAPNDQPPKGGGFGSSRPADGPLGGEAAPPPDLAGLRPCMEDITEHHRLALPRNAFGLTLATEGDQLYLSTRHRVGLPNLGFTCFVNASLQVLLRIEPLYRVLCAHAGECLDGDRECAWCCLHSQARELRMDKRVGECPMALMARRGRFGHDYACALPGGAVTSTRAMAPVDAVCTPKGKLRKGPECDATDFLVDVLETLVWQERAFSDVTRSVIDHEIFGFITRRRYHCPLRDCKFTRDQCIVQKIVELELRACEEPLALRELWDARWRKTWEPDELCCPSAHEGRETQEFMETEPPCLIIRLLRAKKTANGVGKKIRTPVSFPRRLDWMRSGPYGFVGAILHHGDTKDTGHYTAACMVDPSAVDRSTGRHGFVHFNDEGTSGQRWSFFQQRPQQKAVCTMVYTRVARRAANQDTGGSLPFVVGAATEAFRRPAPVAEIIDLDAGPRQLSAEQLSRIEANRQRAMALREAAAKRPRTS